MTSPLTVVDICSETAKEILPCNLHLHWFCGYVPSIGVCCS